LMLVSVHLERVALTLVPPARAAFPALLAVLPLALPRVTDRVVSRSMPRPARTTMVATTPTSLLAPPLTSLLLPRRTAARMSPRMTTLRPLLLAPSSLPLSLHLLLPATLPAPLPSPVTTSLPRLTLLPLPTRPRLATALKRRDYSPSARLVFSWTQMTLRWQT
jgi:hypothetical protein